MSEAFNELLYLLIFIPIGILGALIASALSNGGVSRRAFPYRSMKARAIAKAKHKEQRERKEQLLKENIKSSLAGEYIGKKYYYKQEANRWSRKCCPYCGETLVRVTFEEARWHSDEDIGLYYCMRCNTETQQFMEAEYISLG